MRERVPEWLAKVVGGLGDGKDWLLRELRSLPMVVRAGGWLAFQGVLFKIQPQLWYALVEIAGVVGEVAGLERRTQLLLLVLCLLSGLTAFVVPKLNSLHSIVESMETSGRETETTVADGGSPAKRREKDELSPSGAGAISGAIAGGALGFPWGPAGVIGLAVLGAMVGDEWEQRILDS